MFSRDEYFVVYGVDGRRWADRYGIEPFSLRCRCGVLMETTLPIARGSIRGLLAPKCVCGNTDVPYCVVRDPSHGDLFTGGDRNAKV